MKVAKFLRISFFTDHLHKKTDSNFYLKKESCVKTIHVKVQQKQNCFHKKSYTHTEMNFNVNCNCKKELWFCFSVYEKWKSSYFGIVIFSVGGKNYIGKNENCIAFPKWRYVNSYPDWWFQGEYQLINRF